MTPAPTSEVTRYVSGVLLESVPVKPRSSRAGVCLLLVLALFVAEARAQQATKIHQVGYLSYGTPAGLMSYFPDAEDTTRRAATYIDKILKGARPADLPVEQASTYELYINLKTAKKLGIALAPGVLQRADRLLE